MRKSGDIGYMPEVDGLFSELDLRTGVQLSATVTSQTHTTRATALQTTTRVLSAITALLTFILVAVGGSNPRSPTSLRSVLNGIASRVRWVDATVFAVLGGWWILSPAHWDDGWVEARQGGFESVRGFSNYYDSFGANLPNGYWLEWAQHWITRSADSILAMRLPALLALAAAWIVSRWVVSRILNNPPADGVVLWALAFAYAAGALAWGMTLRPEPYTALFVLFVFACAIWFAQRESPAALALAVAMIPLAATAHHAGVLAAAPLIAIGPQLISWIRRNVAAATALVTAGFAVLVVLAFVGSDIAQRSLDAQALRAYGVPDAWFDELRRYARLSDFHGGPPLRRGSFALMALAVVAYLSRRTRLPHSLLDVPGTTLIVGLVLLIAVPSKWPWHLGALIGIAAIAIAAETYRIRFDETRPRGWRARWLLAVATITIAIAWSWGPREHWTLLDVRTIDWTEDRMLVSFVAAAVPTVVLVASALALRRKKRPPSDAPWGVANLGAALVIVPMLVFTAAILSVDAARSDWTLARQNLGSLAGRAGCGLADTIVIPAPRSMRSVTTAVGSSRREPLAEWVPPEPVPGVGRFVLGPSGSRTSSSPWFEVPRGRKVGLFLAGYESVADGLMLEWGETHGGRVERLSRTRLRVDPEVTSVGIDPWRFVVASDLPRAPRHGNALRLTLITNSQPGSLLVVTAPVTYQSQTLARSLEAPGTKSLVSPALITYMPCASLPVLADGVAQVPELIVSPDGVWLPNPELPVGYRTSPFRGVTDLYDVERVPTADSELTPLLNIWRVMTQIPGARIVPPVRREVTS